MKILHITAHLGGGVGKAHSALCAATGQDIQRHYVLLEAPRDLRFADMLKSAGAEITIAPDADTLIRLAAEADIVQIEWWNHPRIYECLCRAGLPAMRTVFWSHISGMFAPYIPTGLFSAAGTFLFTSACSLQAPNVTTLPDGIRRTLGVVNSGFGFEGVAPDRQLSASPSVAYLGTVDFSKMSPLFFDVIDSVETADVPVSIWGAADLQGDVVRRASEMHHPDRISFRGHAANPADIFAATTIFLYLLQPHHFGTAENALIEAMSLGSVPLVFDNPAEAVIVRHGETGFVEKDATAVARRLEWMIEHPEDVARIGRNAAADVAATRTPALSAAALASVYDTVMLQERKLTDFGAIFGATPADWFLSTQQIEGVEPASGSGALLSASEAKGSLSHFLACFPGDPSLLDLAAAVRSAPND